MSHSTSGPLFGKVMPLDATIRNLPDDTISYKVRLRNEEFVRIVVRRPHGVDEYLLCVNDLTKEYYIDEDYLTGRNQKVKL